MKNVICNECGKDFEAKFQHEILGKDENGGEVVLTYLECPHCNRRFNSLIKDSIYEDMLAEYRRLGRVARNSAKNNANPAIVQANINKMNHYEQSVMKLYYAKLKQQWSTEVDVDANEE